jgi:hypothetical protein
MLKAFLIALLLSGSCAFGQTKFEIKNASKNYDVQIEVEKCENEICEGKATFILFKKGLVAPFQIFRLADTSFMLNSSKGPSVNTTKLYDEQSAVNFGDYNFDGMEDLALCDGTKGGYGMPSYQIYLYSPEKKKFVNSPALTRLAQGENLGMFEVDPKKKVLRTFGKSGCCFHVTREFSVVSDRPMKVLEIIEDATIPNEKKTRLTIKRFINGHWHTTVRYERRAAQSSRPTLRHPAARRSNREQTASEQESCALSHAALRCLCRE